MSAASASLPARPAAGPWGLLFAVGGLLGLALPGAKAMAGLGVPALAFAAWPTTVAGLLLVLLAAARQPRPAPWGRTLRFSAVAGVAGHAVPMTAAFALSASAGAGITAMAFTLPPVFTLATALLLRRERFQPMRLAAVGVGLAGAAALVLGRHALAPLTLPALLGLLAVPALVGATNVYRAVKLPPGVAAEWLGGLLLLASGSVLMLVGLLGGGLAVPLTAPVLGGLALQSALMTLAYLLYFLLQRRADPVLFSFIGQAMMVSGVGVGVLFFGERLPWSAWPALALVLAAMRLMHRYPARPVVSR